MTYSDITEVNESMMTDTCAITSTSSSVLSNDRSSQSIRPDRPILFILCTLDLAALIETHGFRSHLYADDSQVYAWCRPSDVADFQLRLSSCIDGVALWIGANPLQLNTSKTDLLWCFTTCRQSQLPCIPLRLHQPIEQCA